MSVFLNRSTRRLAPLAGVYLRTGSVLRSFNHTAATAQIGVYSAQRSFLISVLLGRRSLDEQYVESEKQIKGQAVYDNRQVLDGSAQVAEDQVNHKAQGASTSTTSGLDQYLGSFLSEKLLSTLTAYREGFEREWRASISPYLLVAEAIKDVISKTTLTSGPIGTGDVLLILRSLFSTRKIHDGLERVHPSYLLDGPISNRRFLRELIDQAHYAEAAYRQSTNYLFPRTMIRPDDLLQGITLPKPHRPGYFLAVDRTKRTIVLSISGTRSVADVVTNLTASVVEVELFGTRGYVHRGIWIAAQAIHSVVRDEIIDVMREVRRHEAQEMTRMAQPIPGHGRSRELPRPYTLTIVGHSMGGGVAACLAGMLRQDFAPRAVRRDDQRGSEGSTTDHMEYEDLMQRCGGVAHGIKCTVFAPPACFSQELARAMDGSVTSVVNGDDCVPRLNLRNIDALLTELRQADAAAQLESAQAEEGRRALAEEEQMTLAAEASTDSGVDSDVEFTAEPPTPVPGGSVCVYNGGEPDRRPGSLGGRPLLNVSNHDHSENLNRAHTATTRLMLSWDSVYLTQSLEQSVVRLLRNLQTEDQWRYLKSIGLNDALAHSVLRSLGSYCESAGRAVSTVGSAAATVGSAAVGAGELVASGAGYVVNSGKYIADAVEPYVPISSVGNAVGTVVGSLRTTPLSSSKDDHSNEKQNIRGQKLVDEERAIAEEMRDKAVTDEAPELIRHGRHVVEDEEADSAATRTLEAPAVRPMWDTSVPGTLFFLKHENTMSYENSITGANDMMNNDAMMDTHPDEENDSDSASLFSDFASTEAGYEKEQQKLPKRKWRADEDFADNNTATGIYRTEPAMLNRMWITDSIISDHMMQKTIKLLWESYKYAK
eukprot:Clim_evm7s97 gene=Clim_evmTU7s97